MIFSNTLQNRIVPVLLFLSRNSSDIVHVSPHLNGFRRQLYRFRTSKPGCFVTKM